MALVYFDSSALVKLVLDEAGSDITASCSSSPSVRYQPSNSSVYSTYSELVELGPDGVEALAAETGGVEPLSEPLRARLTVLQESEVQLATAIDECGGLGGREDLRKELTLHYEAVLAEESFDE